MKPYVNPKRIRRLSKRAEAAWRSLTARLRVLPDFLIIGGNRCGTAALYQYLSEHPSVAAAFHREIHFFERHFRRGTGWYRAHFPTALERLAVTGLRGRPLLTGEATTYYSFHPHAARRIRALLPEARLIMLVRNPADRAYSQYHQKVRRGYEPLAFEEALAAEAERLSGEREKMLADERYDSFAYRHFSYLARGRYVEQLEAWTALFPRDRLLVLASEDLKRNPSQVLKDTLAFLGLPMWEPRAYGEREPAHYPPMDRAVRARLLEHFAPHNRRLGDFWGRTFDWDR
jgi:hypothetical protein